MACVDIPSVSFPFTTVPSCLPFEVYKKMVHTSNVQVCNIFNMTCNTPLLLELILNPHAWNLITIYFVLALFSFFLNQSWI